MAKKTESAVSGTQTAEVKSPQPSTSVTDAEVAQDVPARPKVVSAKPLDASKVFDADVSDAKNAAPGVKPDGATSEERTKRTYKKRGAEEAPPEPTDAQTAKARNYVKMAEGLHRMGLRARYVDMLSPESLVELDARMMLSPEQVDVMALPLADGLAKHGAILPWYVELGIGALGIGMARANVCKRIEEEYQRKEKAKEAAKP